MKTEIKNLWTTALRSGEYKQGEGALQDDEGNFCCLGVLCDIAVKQGVLPEPELTDTFIREKYAYGRNTEFPPEVVLEWAGLTETDPEVVKELDEDGFEEHASLSDLNDNYHYSFNQIADVIDAQL